MLEKFKVFIEKLKASNSRLYKEAVLKEYQNDDLIKEITKFIFNPYVVTGISKKKFYKSVVLDWNYDCVDIIGVMKYLESHNHGSDIDIANVRHFVTRNYEYEDIIYAIVCKDLTVGVTATTINKIWGKGFIPTFDVMLAEKYFDDPEKYLPEGTEFILTEKLDGVRCALIFDKQGSPHFFSRNGKEIMDLVDLAEEADHLDKNYIYDGELLANTVGHSKDVYRDTMSVVGSDNIKQNILYNVFDAIPYRDFVSGYSAVSALSRKQGLHTELSGYDYNWIKEVPMLYVGRDQSKIQEYLNWAKSLNKEGVMINVASAGYECRRSRKLLKVKTSSECEAYVIDLEEGTGKNAGRLGKIVVQVKDKEERLHLVRAGSGFEDWERDEYWQHPEKLLRKVVELQYFEVTNNKDDDSLSLRFPVWMGRIREDKSLTEMNTL